MSIACSIPFITLGEVRFDSWPDFQVSFHDVFFKITLILAIFLKKNNHTLQLTFLCSLYSVVVHRHWFWAWVRDWVPMVFPRRADISHTPRQMDLGTTDWVAAALAHPAAPPPPAAAVQWGEPRREHRVTSLAAATAVTATTRPPSPWWGWRKIPTGVHPATNFWLPLCDHPMQPMLLVSLHYITYMTHYTMVVFTNFYSTIVIIF